MTAILDWVMLDEWWEVRAVEGARDFESSAWKSCCQTRVVIVG